MDEAAHKRYHRRVLSGVIVRGAAAGRLLLRRPDGTQVVSIHSSDSPERLKKLAEAKRMVDDELGCTTELPDSFRAFLCLSPRGRMIGCAIAEPRTEGFRLLERESHEAVVEHDGEAQPVLCGIALIWVAREHRRTGVGLQLLESVRYIELLAAFMHANSLHSSVNFHRQNMIIGFEMPKEKMAFSQPTAHGSALAAAYTGTRRFLVYS